MAPAPLSERIARFIARPDAGGFGELAMEAFAELYRADPAYRDLCDRARRTPGQVDDWRSIPAATPRETALRSGPAQGLERQAAERAFRDACLNGLEAPPILDLTGGTLLARDALEGLGGPGSSSPVERGRVDVVAARSWLAARQRDHRPAVVLLDQAARERLFGALERQDLRFQLAPGSRIVLGDPVGDPGDVAAACGERFGAATALVARHVWAGVPTPLFGRPTPGGGLEGAIASPWVRVLAAGSGPGPGRLSILDLAIRERPFHLTSESSGAVDGRAVTIS